MDVFGNEIQLPGLFHSLKVSTGMKIAAEIDINTKLAKIIIPAIPILLFRNSCFISVDVILLRLFSPVDQSTHKANLQEKY